MMVLWGWEKGVVSVQSVSQFSQPRGLGYQGGAITLALGTKMAVMV